MNKRENIFYSTKDVCEKMDISKNTLFRWEKDKKTPKPKRDWKGYRLYSEQDIEEIKKVIAEKSKQFK